LRQSVEWKVFRSGSLEGAEGRTLPLGREVYDFLKRQ
jgi:hypothetical protein